MKKQSYQAFEVGESFGPVPFRVDDHFVKGFAFAVDDWSSAYFRDPGRCGPWAHSSGVAKKLLHLFMETYDPQQIQSVHLKEDIWFHAPVPFGETLTLTGSFTDKYVRKGRPSVVLDSKALDPTGKLLVRQRSIEIVPPAHPFDDTEQRPFEGLSTRRVSGRWPEWRHAAGNAEDVDEPDTPLPILVKTIHQDQMSVFVGANDNWRNIHTDPGVAHAAGFNGTIMSGMIQACWFTEMMVSYFGPAFLSGGQLGMTFLRPVHAGETIECLGVARTLDGDGAIEVEFWSKNACGEMTAGGWAIGRTAGKGAS